MHTARLWDTDKKKKKAEPGTECVSLGSYYAWWMLQGKSLLSQAVDIPLILRGRVAIYSHFCTPVGKTVKIRGKMFKWPGKVKEGIRRFDFKFCHVHSPDEI